MILCSMFEREDLVIVSRVELPVIMIEQCGGLFLSKFWGIVVEESFDITKGIYMLTVMLYSPWGSFDVSEVVRFF